MKPHPISATDGVGRLRNLTPVWEAAKSVK